MPLSKMPLQLPADPRAVRDARSWVRDLLTTLGRDDLVDSAQLGVSELVTNAVLHATPPLTVSVRGTREHPRIEVHDGSDSLPSANDWMGEEEYLLTTYGRGLGIVSWYSSRWGADLTGDGKTVWFEPTAEPDPEHEVAGDVFDLAREVDRDPGHAPDASALVPVRLLRMPVQLFREFRFRYAELSRELRLLSLAHGDDYPIAQELTQLAMRVERERRQAHGVDQLDRAIAEGLVEADLEYLVPPATPGTMEQLQDLLERVEEFCREERMLALAASPLQLRLQRWYLSEFVRQGRGEDAVPWAGVLEGEPAKQ